MLSFEVPEKYADLVEARFLENYGWKKLNDSYYCPFCVQVSINEYSKAQVSINEYSKALLKFSGFDHP